VSRTFALAWMRLRGYVRSQRALGPALAAVALLGIAYAGGPSSAKQAYGFSAAVLLAAYAWSAKSLLDLEPDEQRLIARASVGSARRELAAGLLAALVATLPIVVLAALLPTVFGFVNADGPAELTRAVVLGFWCHGMAALCGTGIGALASRAVTTSIGWAVLILAGSPVLVLILGSRDSFVRWLVPPVLGPADAEQWPALLLVTVVMLAWIAGLVGGYAALRRTRA
jgi:hypothetical protein